MLELDTSLIAFPERPRKRVCCKSNRRLQLEMVTEDNLATTQGLQWRLKSLIGMKALSWSAFLCPECSSSSAEKMEPPWGQGYSEKFLYSTQPLTSMTATRFNDSHFMPYISFSALLKDTWLLHNNTRSSQWVHGRRISLQTKYHFLHLSFNTFISG